MPIGQIVVADVMAELVEEFEQVITSVESIRKSPTPGVDERAGIQQMNTRRLGVRRA